MGTVTYTIGNATHAIATMALPLLTCDFLIAASQAKVTAEDVIRNVVSGVEALKRRHSNGANPLNEALSYEEVGSQFFDWFDKLESIGKVTSMRLASTAAF